MSTTYTASALPHSGTPLFEVTALTDGVAAVYTICVADGGTEADAIAIAQAKHESPPTAYVVTAAHYSEAIEQHLDAVAQSRGYRNADRAASYVASSNQLWAAESQTFVIWRDVVWAYAYKRLAAVMSGQASPPTIPALVASLPAIQWPG